MPSGPTVSGRVISSGKATVAGKGGSIWILFLISASGLAANGKAVALASPCCEKEDDDAAGYEGDSRRDHAANKICAASSCQDRCAVRVSQLEIFLSQVHVRRLPR